MTSRETTPRDPFATGLAALGWALGDDARASRLLALTGLDPATLRARVGDPSLLAAALGFLEAHEPDLLACANALDVPATELIAARRLLENAS